MDSLVHHNLYIVNMLADEYDDNKFVFKLNI
jgi:hypothetical protein